VVFQFSRARISQRDAVRVCLRVCLHPANDVARSPKLDRYDRAQSLNAKLKEMIEQVERGNEAVDAGQGCLQKKKRMRKIR